MEIRGLRCHVGVRLLTTPISSFVIARAAYLRGEKMEVPNALDESGKNLPEGQGVDGVPPRARFT